MPGFFNTITAPQEQAIADTGNDQSSNQQPDQSSQSDSAPQPQRQSVFKPQDMPMGRIMSAVMRSAAAVQGQEQAKKVVSDQAMDMSKFSLTLKRNPNGGPPIADLKNAPIDMINGRQQADVQAAYNTPKEQVEKKLNAGTQQQEAPPAAPTQPSAPTTPPPQDHPLEQAAAAVDASTGYRLPRPWDPDIREKLKSEEGLRQIADELGLRDTKAEAHRAWRQLQHGVATADDVAQRIADFRAKKIEQASHNLQSTLEPYQQEAAKKQAETYRQQTAAREQERLTDAENQKIYQHQQDVVKATDYSLMGSDQEAFASTRDQLGGGELSDTLKARVLRKREQDIAADLKRFTDDKAGLATYASPKEAAAHFGHKLSTEQQGKMAADWTAATNAVKRQQEITDRADQRLAFIMRDKPEKPHKLSPWEVVNLSSDALLAAKGDASVEQGSVDRGISAKVGNLTTKLAENAAQQKGIAASYPQEAHVIFDEKGAIKPGAEQANPFIYTRVMDAQKQRARLQAEADSLNAELSKLTQGAGQSVAKGERGSLVKVGGRLVYQPH